MLNKTCSLLLLACLPLLGAGCDAPIEASPEAGALTHATVLGAGAVEEGEGCFCPQVYDPVCGVDGNTYGNGCEAACAGVKVEHEGECSEDPGCFCPQVYDPVCGVDGNTYGNGCEAGCADVAVAHEGECAAEKPGCVCPQVYDPVCGVDGHTYGNGCMASCAGVAVAHEGECEKGACADNSQCGKGQFCQQDLACGELGVCETQPFGCAKILAPVCGCDGNTYGNECMAHSAGVSVASEGECKSDAGCTDDYQCGKGQFCARDYDCGGVGTCTARPDACLDVYDPVCGCDGNTYGNGCYAHSAGVSIAGGDVCGGGGVDE